MPSDNQAPQLTPDSRVPFEGAGETTTPTLQREYSIVAGDIPMYTYTSSEEDTQKSGKVKKEKKAKKGTKRARGEEKEEEEEKTVKKVKLDDRTLKEVCVAVCPPPFCKELGEILV